MELLDGKPPKLRGLNDGRPLELNDTPTRLPPNCLGGEEDNDLDGEEVGGKDSEDDTASSSSDRR
jgi:hypothetical protein